MGGLLRRAGARAPDRRVTIRPQDLAVYAGGDCLDKYGVLFRRGSLAQDVAENFTRASTGLYIAKGGVAKLAAVDVPRVSYSGTEWADAAWLLERGGTNLCLQSEDFGVTWAVVGTPTRTPANFAANGVTLDLIGDDDGAALEGYTQKVTFVGTDAVPKTIAVRMKAGTSGSVVIRVRDTSAAADRLLAVIAWAGGVPTVAMTTGIDLDAASPEPFPDGEYRFRFQTTAVTKANVNSVQVYPATDAALLTSSTGNVNVGGVQVEDALYPGSYMKVTTVAVARAVEAATWVPYLRPPQLSTLYLKFREAGTILDATGSVLLHIGLTAAATDARLVIRQTGGFYEVLHDNGTAEVSSTLAAAPNLGDTVELRAEVAADGSVRIHQAINAAAESSAAASAANAFATTWAGPATRLYLNSHPDATLPGALELQALKIALAGAYSMAELRAVV